MTRITALVCVATLAITPAAGVSQGTANASRAEFLRLIERPRVPLAPEVHALPGDSSLTREHFTFASQAGERVPGVLVKSSSASNRRPAVILLHGTGGSKADAQ